MKVAVTTVGDGLDAAVDPRFGRARKFLIVDTDTLETRVVENRQNLLATEGAGVQAGQNVVRQGVDAVITGNVGPKALAVLQTAGVRVYAGAGGTVREALEALREGRLVETDRPTRPGHRT